MKHRGRAWRRSQRERKERRVRQYYSFHVFSNDSYLNSWNSDRWVNLMATTHKPCSCWMCCNQRSKNSWTKGDQKLTIQERKHKYWLSDYMEENYGSDDSDSLKVG